MITDGYGGTETQLRTDGCVVATLVNKVQGSECVR